MDKPTIYNTDGGVVFSWASILDDATRLQAEMISRSKVVSGHVALMPDAHLGLGATVGCVIPTKNAIIPAAIGVDIGCGVLACRTSLKREDIDEKIAKLILGEIRNNIPAGVGQGYDKPSEAAEAFFAKHDSPLADYSQHKFGVITKNPIDKSRLIKSGLLQFGTLGSGNHFVEVSADQNDNVWLMLHSGSRGIGNQLAMLYIKEAEEYCKENNISLEHRDLAYLVEGTNAFAYYIHDMLWAQTYAWAQREEMMHQLCLAISLEFVIVERVHCHHNYSEKQLDGTWLSRKGSIDASIGKKGIIPGSMGAETHIVVGLGNVDSYCSSPHGAGRMLSRTGAKKNLSIEEFRVQMQNIVWDDWNAQKLLDEAPFAYKPIKQVMEDSKDLVKTEAVLSQFINYKGF